MASTMRWAMLALLVPTILPAALFAGQKEMVAVVELENQSKRVSDNEAQFITDAVRKAAADALDQRSFTVMTRESMDVLLPPSKVLCLAGKCLAEIGRTLQAKFVVGGSMKDVGSKIGLTLELYDSVTGALLGSEQALGGDVDQLVAGAQQLAPKLMRKVAGGGGIPQGQGVAPLLQGGPHVESVGAIREELGMLRVEGSPKGAQIDIRGPGEFGDGGKLQTTLPWGPAEVPAGEFKIKVTAPDYDGDEKRVLVRADRTEVVRVDLVQSYGLINIQGSPQGAKVDLTCAGGFNKVFGLPGQLSVPHGPCTVVVKRVGYKTFSRTVQIAGGGSETVDVSLQEGEDVVAAPTPTYTPPEDTSWSPSSYGIVPFVNRPALLADEAGEAFLSFDLGLDASSTQNGVNYGPAKRVGMDLGFGYGMGFAEVDVKLKAMRYVSMGPGLNLSSGTPVAVEPADHAILLPGEPNGTNYGGAAFGGIDLGFKFTLIGRAMGAEIALEVPGKHVSDNKVRFRFAFPFKITFKDDIVAFHGNLGSTMGFANSSDWGVNIQMSVWANYGLSFNVMRRWYVDVTSSIWKWVLPDSNPLTPDGGLFIGLQVMTGVTIVPGLDMTLASTLNDLYNHGAESRDLIFGMSYHFGDY